MVQITWNLNVEIGDSPKLTVTGHPLTVDAYDKIEATIPAAKNGAASKTEVEIQPGDQVEIFLITSSLYSSETNKLAYTVDGETKEIELDAPQFLVGAGAMGLLPGSPNNPKKLTFTNALEKAATVQIHVGRKAIKSP